MPHRNENSGVSDHRGRPSSTAFPAPEMAPATHPARPEREDQAVGQYRIRTELITERVVELGTT